MLIPVVGSIRTTAKLLAKINSTNFSHLDFSLSLIFMLTLQPVSLSSLCAVSFILGLHAWSALVQK